MPIGAKLQALFNEKNTNVNEVASRTGISPNTIYSLIRRDSEKANIDDLYRVAHHLGVTLNYFVDTEDNVACIKSEQNTGTEAELIKKYRTLDEHGIEVVNAVIEIEYKRCSEHSVPRLRAARGGGLNTEPLPIEYEGDCDTSDLKS